MWADVARYWPLPATAIALIVAAVTDVRSGKIPNAVTYPAVFVGLVANTLVGGLGMSDISGGLGLLGALLGMGVGATLLLAWLAGGIGGGDAKLMIAIGALAGWRFALAAMFWGFAVAAVMAIVVMIRKRVVRRTLTRIGRFLLLVFTPARPASPATEDSPKIPFGLALCIGAAVALGEAMMMHGSAMQKFLIGV